MLACRYVCSSVVDFWLGYLLSFVQHYAQYSAETQAAITELVDVSPNWKVSTLLLFQQVSTSDRLSW